MAFSWEISVPYKFSVSYYTALTPQFGRLIANNCRISKNTIISIKLTKKFLS